MRILVVTPFLAAPGTDGGRTLMFNLIRNLSARHEIVYLTFVREPELPLLDGVAPFCAEVVTVPLPGGPTGSAMQKGLNLARRVLQNVLSFATLTPVVVQKCRSHAMHVEIAKCIERFQPDLVHFVFPQMAHYVDACGNVPTVMDTSDVALLGVFRRAMSARSIFGKLYYLAQWLFWVRYESRYFPRFGKVLTVTHQDAAAVKMILPDLDVYADAIAVDLEPLSDQTKTVRAATRRIGFLASFGHQPNVDAALYFAQEILPQVRARLQGAEFVVAGKNPPAALQGQEGVTCLGFVVDVPTFYDSVDLVVAPLRFGGGIKIKVLEAMACAKPVVTTSVGAEGIAEIGTDALVIADDSESFAAAVCALLSDPARRDAVGNQGHQLVQRRFSWRRVVDDLDGIYNKLVKGGR